MYMSIIPYDILCWFIANYLIVYSYHCLKRNNNNVDCFESQTFDFIGEPQICNLLQLKMEINATQYNLK